LVLSRARLAPTANLALLTAVVAISPDSQTLDWRIRSAPLVCGQWCIAEA